MIGETMHSGHFMMSSLTDESSDTDSGCPVGRIRSADLPVSREFIRTSMRRESHGCGRMLDSNSVADVIDGSLVTLLRCMTLDYRFATQKPIAYRLAWTKNLCLCDTVDLQSVTNLNFIVKSSTGKSDSSRE